MQTIFNCGVNLTFMAIPLVLALSTLGHLIARLLTMLLFNSNFHQVSETHFGQPNLFIGWFGLRNVSVNGGSICCTISIVPRVQYLFGKLILYIALSAFQLCKD